MLVKQNIVEHQKREGQDRGRAENVQGIGQRNEAPFRGGQIENVTNDHAERDEPRQDAKQKRQTDEEKIALETKIEARQ